MSVLHIDIEPEAVTLPDRWPLCDLCECPLGAGAIVIGYPRHERTAFGVHKTCWNRCAERLGRLLELYRDE